MPRADAPAAERPAGGEPAEELEAALDFFKALANEQRLRILGLLAARPAVVEEIAGALALSAGTVSHHLRILRQAGLVSAENDQQYRLYHLRARRLREMGRDLARLENLRLGAGPFPAGAYEDKVLSVWVQRGRLVGIPAQRKKREVILRWLAEKFAPGRDYPEPEVNRLIGRFHEDYCTLRRELIMNRLLTREHGVYRRRA